MYISMQFQAISRFFHLKSPGNLQTTEAWPPFKKEEIFSHSTRTNRNEEIKSAGI